MPGLWISRRFAFMQIGELGMAPVPNSQRVVRPEVSIPAARTASEEADWPVRTATQWRPCYF